jgi:hypothetical protein
MSYFMRPIDRVHAERQLLAAFNNQLNWAEIDIFFRRMHIPHPEFGGESYSLTDLTRGYLAECSDETLLNIAQQLDLDVTPEHGNENAIVLGDSKYWLIDHLRVFISHVHTAKLQAGGLRNALRRYGISAFVAHEDIDTSDEWRDEILRALMSMDAFVAILTPDFSSSRWTDQETGVAVARNVLSIPINRGEIPYGFLSRYQALASKGLVAREVAAEVFRTVSASQKTRGRMVDSLTRLISAGSDVSDSLFRIERLKEIVGVSVEEWERVRENIASNDVLRSSQELVESLNETLKEKNLASIEVGSKSRSIDDEIPF